MSETDSASPIVTHTSPSETPSTPSINPSHTDPEKQPLELPGDWQQVNKLTCWMSIGETNLENFWVHVREKGWEKANERLRDSVTQITAAVCILLPSLSCKLTHLFSQQGLIIVVCAAFLTTTPPVEPINYARRRCYIWLLWSFMFSIWGLICQLMFLRVNMSLSIQDILLVGNF